MRPFGMSGNYGEEDRKWMSEGIAEVKKEGKKIGRGLWTCFTCGVVTFIGLSLLCGVIIYALSHR